MGSTPAGGTGFFRALRKGVPAGRPYTLRCRAFPLCGFMQERSCRSRLGILYRRRVAARGIRTITLCKAGECMVACGDFIRSLVGGFFISDFWGTEVVWAAEEVEPPPPQ